MAKPEKRTYAHNRRVHPPDPKGYPKQLRPGKYDMCKDRSIGHDWFITDVEKKSSFGYPVWHMCARCTTVRKRILDVTGYVMAQWYKHPDDYKYDFNPGQVRLWEMREWYKHARKELDTTHD